MLVGSFGGGISLLLLIPLLHYTGIAPVPLAENHQSGWLTQIIPTHMSLVAVLMLYAAVVIVFASLNYVRSIYSASLLQRSISQCRQRLFAAICYAPWSLLAQQTPSDLNQLLTSEIQRISGALQQGLQWVTSCLVSMAYLLVALYLSWQVTAIAVLACASLLLVTRQYTAYAKGGGRQSFYVFRNVHKTIEQTLQGLKQAKLWQSESHTIDQLGRCNEMLQRTQMQFAISQARTQWVFTAGAVFAISVLFYVGRVQLHIALSHIMVLIISFARLLPRVLSAQKSYQLLINNLSGLPSLIKLYQQCASTAKRSGHKSIAPLRAKIVLQSLSYRYAGSAQDTLCGLNLTIQAGSITAITGASGCGKSTLMDCLVGLLVPQQGQILVDGVALSDDHRRSWLQQVAYVSQDPYLLNASLRDNFLWVKSDASDAEIWRALEQAQASSFVAKFPERLDSIVGNRGLCLSGGERQRIVLAQAILRQARVLILDEATSQLDSHHDQLIQKALKSLHGKVTMIIVAHRLSSLALADQVVLLEQGRCLPHKSTSALQESYAIETY